MTYLIFLAIFLLASITTSSGQVCSAVNSNFPASARVKDVRRVKFYLDPTVKRGADIVLQFSPVAGNNPVAMATAPPTQVQLTFDSREIWATGSNNPPQDSLDLESVALHLIGHAIGLGHRGNIVANKGTVMNRRLVDRFGATVYEGITKTSLQTRDIILAVAKYGGPC